MVPEVDEVLDYFKGLKHFSKILPGQIPKNSGIVYGGHDVQHRTDVSIVPFVHLDDLFNPFGSAC